MDKYVYVYCTNCLHMESNLECIGCTDGRFASLECNKCPCHECDCYNPEDSDRFKNRPGYIAKD